MLASIGKAFAEAINIGEIADMVGMLANMGVRKVSWLRFVPQGRGGINRNLLQLTREQLRRLAYTKNALQRMYPQVAIRYILMGA